MSKLKSIIFLLLFFLLGTYQQAEWVDVYKKGEITLSPDPEFGKDTDWDFLFFNLNKKIAVAPDGSIFVSDLSQDKIFKFDRQGNFLKAFGQRGQGPGDVIQPSDLTILDGRYLVVRESSDSNRRISIFGLDTKFVDIIKSQSYILQCTALKNNKIAYLTQQEKPDEFLYFTVYIVDIPSKQKKRIVSFKQRIRKTNIKAGSFYGRVFIGRVNEGNLVVGYSAEPEISIYSPGGETLHSFKVNVKPLKVSGEMKREFFELMREEAQKKPFLEYFIKKMNTTDIFPEYIPFYRKIAVDSDGNILIFKHNGFDKIKELEFQVYSPGGNYVCDSKINFGTFKPTLLLNVVFHNDGLYCILEKEDSDDSYFKLAKVRIK